MQQSNRRGTGIFLHRQLRLRRYRSMCSRRDLWGQRRAMYIIKWDVGW